MDEILIEADEGTRRLEKEDVCVGIVGIVWERLITSYILQYIEICNPITVSETRFTDICYCAKKYAFTCVLRV